MATGRIIEFRQQYETGEEDSPKAPIEITFEEFEVLCDLADRDPSDEVRHYPYGYNEDEQKILRGLVVRELMA